ncbi:MAG: hypothetical protein SGILL_000123 [Bacillariaceae sp.]
MGNGSNTPIIDFDDWSEDPFTYAKESDVFAAFENDEQGVAAGAGGPKELPSFPSGPDGILMATTSAPALLQMQQHLHPQVHPQVEETRKRTAPEPASATSSSASAPAVSSSSTKSCFSRRKKKPKGMPKRPLSAYNLYFQAERFRIIEEQEKEGDDGPKIGFEGLGKIIGKQWRDLSNADKKKYEILAEKDGERYRKEMDKYNELKTKRLEEQDNRPLSNPQFTSPASLEASSSLAAAPPLALQTDASSASYVYVPISQLNTGMQHLPSMPSDSYTTKALTGQAPPGHGAPAPSVALSYDGGGSTAPGGVNGTHHLSPAQAPRPTASLGLQQYQQQAMQTMGGTLRQIPSHGSASAFPLPPGMEIVLSDCNGVDRKYRVNYTCYSMTREAAHQYLESLTGGSAPTGSNINSGAGSYGAAATVPTSTPTAMPPPPQGQQPLPPPQVMGPPLYHYGTAWGR